MKKFLMMSVVMGVIGWMAPLAQASDSHKLPDFKVEDIKVSPKSFYAGDYIKVEVKIKNGGKADGDAGWVEIQVAGDTYYAYAGYLKKGKTKTIRFSHVYTDSHSSKVRIKAYVDAYDWTHESNEHNNRKSKEFKAKKH